MYARVPQAMTQFVLKIELLSHIMGTTPILEMARAYGLRPRLWLLILPHSSLEYSFSAAFSTRHISNAIRDLTKVVEMKHEFVYLSHGTFRATSF